jgi:hypothetical protein
MESFLSKSDTSMFPRNHVRSSRLDAIYGQLFDADQ